MLLKSLIFSLLLSLLSLTQSLYASSPGNIPPVSMVAYYHPQTDDKATISLKSSTEQLDNTDQNTQTYTDTIADKEKESNPSRSVGFFNLVFILGSLVFLGIYVGLYGMVIVMARKRNRDPLAWVLLSFVSTPILICFILLIVGDNR